MAGLSGGGPHALATAALLPHAGYHEAFRYGVEGFLDDFLSFVKPWGSSLDAITVPAFVPGYRTPALGCGGWLYAVFCQAIASRYWTSCSNVTIRRVVGVGVL